MDRFKFLFAAAVLALCCVPGGCDSRDGLPAGGSPTATPARVTLAERPTAVTAVTNVISRKGQIRFDAATTVDNGESGGFCLILSPDGKAVAKYGGQDVVTSSGSYRFDGETLALDFGADDPWLPMRVSVAGDSILLNAPDKQLVIDAAVAAGVTADQITDQDLAAAYAGWPLRYHADE